MSEYSGTGNRQVEYNINMYIYIIYIWLFCLHHTIIFGDPWNISSICITKTMTRCWKLNATKLFFPHALNVYKIMGAFSTNAV